MDRLRSPDHAGRPQSRGEEIANAASHGGALIAAIGAGLWLVSWGRKLNVEGFAGVCVFVVTMVWLYLASTVYHALPEGRAKRFFLRLDHGAVFLFIAGSYTVFAAGHRGDPWGRAILALGWLVATAGMTLKALGRLASPWLSTGGYVALGWVVLLAAVPLLERASPVATQWLLAGGCAYTVGVVFFVLDARIRYAHAVWHGFVAAGTACHTWAVLG
jgi:hemolysin III